MRILGHSCIGFNFKMDIIIEISYVVVTDDGKHHAEAVVSYMQAVLKDIRMYVTVTKLITFTTVMHHSTKAKLPSRT